MKKILVAALAFTALSASAQKTPVKKPAAKPVAAANPLKNQLDSASYAIGFLVANFYKNQQGMEKINSAMVTKAINDIYTGKTTLMNENQCNTTLMMALNGNLKKNIAEGEAFLRENKNKPGVKTTSTGLQYQVISMGSGEKPVLGDTVVTNYAGTLLDGTEFDNSYKRGAPITFGLDQVIPGWTEALQLMPAGSKFKLWIPYGIAYGMNDHGPIPGGSVLVFELELLEVKKAR